MSSTPGSMRSVRAGDAVVDGETDDEGLRRRERVNPADDEAAVAARAEGDVVEPHAAGGVVGRAGEAGDGDVGEVDLRKEIVAELVDLTDAGAAVAAQEQGAR